MANNLIQIKRSLNTANATGLANGELAFTSNGDVLWIGANGAVLPIAGKRFPGTLTANQALVANATSGIDKIIDNVHEVVKHGGEFRYMVYAKNSWKYAMIQKGLDQFEAQAGCPYAQAFSKDEIHQLMNRDNGWYIERLRQDHCFMYNVDAYKEGRYESEPWFEAMTESHRQAVREYLGWHLLVKARKV